MEVGQYIIQGDVILKRITDLPKDLLKTADKTLQKSEITGHHHRFEKAASLVVFETKDDKASMDYSKFLVVTEEAKLFHGKGFEIDPTLTDTGDHRALDVPKGTYEVVIAQEFNYDTFESARVVD